MRFVARIASKIGFMPDMEETAGFIYCKEPSDGFVGCIVTSGTVNRAFKAGDLPLVEKEYRKKLRNEFCEILEENFEYGAPGPTVNQWPELREVFGAMVFLVNDGHSDVVDDLHHFIHPVRPELVIHQADTAIRRINPPAWGF